MIDLKTLASIKTLAERRNGDNADEMLNGYYHSALKPDVVVAMAKFAMRYLALRNTAKTKEGRIKVQAIFWNMRSRKDIDAAADRLLEGGE